MAYTNIIGRADVSDAMIPEQTIPELIAAATAESAIMTRARRTQLSTRTAKQPVMAGLPDAYWVNGDAGLKQTTKALWDKITITAEELAVIVPIPTAVVDDANIPLWAQIRPLLGEAIGKAVDAAAIFGVNKPASWPSALVTGATAAGNVVQAGTDFAKAVSDLAELIDAKGYAVDGFACRPGLTWRLRGARDLQGRPVFDSALDGTGTFSLFGFGLTEVRNGAWNPQAAELVAADWSKLVFGVRQDVTYDLFSEGVISDDEGKVVLNLMQQDSKAMRVVFRCGFAVATPVTRLEDDPAKRYPAGVVTPESAED